MTDSQPGSLTLFLNLLEFVFIFSVRDLMCSQVSQVMLQFRAIVDVGQTRQPL